MDADTLVLVERRGAVAVITLNEPARMNPFSHPMRRRVLEVFQAEAADPSVRAIVLTGAGGQFSAGADVRQMTVDDTPDPMRSRDLLTALQALVRLVVGGPKPVIAAVEGVAFGAGLSVAAAADWVVASTGARFGAAFGKIGLAPDCGLLWSLPKRIGLVRAKDLIFTGRPLKADEAHALGLVDQLVEPGKVVEAALAKALEYADVAPLTIATVKAALEEGPIDLNHALRLELNQQPMMRMTADHAEGCRAFLEKRKPIFAGR
jgi:enoyl-CoA hydratase/carnithine racemase